MISSETAIPELPRISDYADYWAEHAPDRDALVLGSARYSYSDMAALVDKCAKALLANGIQKGDCVAMLSTPRPVYFIIFLASARIGATWLGLNPKYGLDEYRYVIGDTRPDILFIIPEFEGRRYLGDVAIEQPDGQYRRTRQIVSGSRLCFRDSRT